MLVTKASKMYCNKHFLSQTNPIYPLPIHFLQRHLNIIIISLPNFKSGLLTSSFQQELYTNFSPLSCTLDAPPSTSSLTWLSQYLTSKQYKLWSSTLGHFLHSFVIFFPSDPNILNIFFSGTLCLSYSHIFPQFCTSTTKQHAKF